MKKREELGLADTTKIGGGVGVRPDLRERGKRAGGVAVFVIQEGMCTGK